MFIVNISDKDLKKKVLCYVCRSSKGKNIIFSVDFNQKKFGHPYDNNIEFRQ